MPALYVLLVTCTSFNIFKLNHQRQKNTVPDNYASVKVAFLHPLKMQFWKLYLNFSISFLLSFSLSLSVLEKLRQQAKWMITKHIVKIT